MEASSTRIGTEIAGFRIESVLGRGGMSVVYLAEQTRLGRKVALKVLSSGLVDRDEHFRNRFLQESHVAASLDHPNIIPIYDAGEDKSCLYIAMRYVEGRDLAQIIEHEGPLSLGRTLFILDQVASALDVAHEHGLVHRDVKPGNVLLVGSTDRVYLTDFGVAKPSTSAGLTRTGFFIGTPDYSAPEQIEGRDVDGRTDVYALGAVFYSSLTGFAPYARDTEVAVLQAHLLEPPPKLRDRRPELPRALDRVIATAMAKAKDDRYATCGDLIVAAEAAARDRPKSAPVVGGTVVASPKREVQEREPSETVLGTDAAAPDVATTQASPAEPSVPTGVSPATETPSPTLDASPVQTPPPQAPPAQVAAAREPPGGGRFRPSGRMLIGVLVAALVALGAVLAVVLVTRGGGSSSGSGNGAKGSTSFNVAMSSQGEVPASLATNTSGTSKITIQGTKVCWRFTLRGVDDPTVAHLHKGGPNLSGPVVVPLGDAYAPSGCTAAPAAIARAILASPSTYYVNVHSAKYPNGAVRGQLAGSESMPGMHKTTSKASGLLAMLPSDVPTSSCKQTKSDHPGGIQTVSCDITERSGRRILLHVDNFRDSKSVRAVYIHHGVAEVKAAGGNPDPTLKKSTGDCTGTVWLGEGIWSHAAGEAPAGRRSCYIAKPSDPLCKPTGAAACSVMIWTLDISNLFIRAVVPSTVHRDLFTWWRFHAHLFA